MKSVVFDLDASKSLQIATLIPVQVTDDVIQSCPIKVTGSGTINSTGHNNRTVSCDDLVPFVTHPAWSRRTARAGLDASGMMKNAQNVRLLVLLLLGALTYARVLDLEVRPVRALSPGSHRGFHEYVTLHEENELGWTARYHQVQLYGGIVAVGEYYARIKIGGQTVRVQIDTGSATLAVPMAECDSCKKGDMRYDMRKSDSGQARIISCEDRECEGHKCNTFMCGGCSSKRACCAHSDPSKCAFHLSFGDGSGAKGVLVNDVLQWGDVKFPVTFGGIRHDSPDFERNQVDGIMGMAYPRLACNPSCVKPTFESARDYLGLKDLFSICMTDDGGKITLGEFDDRVNTTAVTWVPMHLESPPTFYNMRLLGNLQIGERSLVLPSYYRAIVDSGTTLIVFSKRAFRRFVKHLQTHYCHIPQLCDKKTWFRPAHCVKISDSDRLQLPTLVFQLEGFNVTLDASEYMINYKSKGPEFWCVGLMALDTMSGGVDVIFGNTVMKKYLTIYDRENERIGFAQSGGSCDPKHQGSKVMSTKAGSLPVLEVPKRSEPNNDRTNSVAAPVSGTQCDGAKNCSECAKLGGSNCFWDTPLAACIPGEATKLMCSLDSVMSHLVYVIVGAVVAVAVIIIGVALFVWISRKRRQAHDESMVDADEMEENKLPLTSSSSS